jgi:hypothetical protein
MISPSLEALKGLAISPCRQMLLGWAQERQELEEAARHRRSGEKQRDVLMRLDTVKGCSDGCRIGECCLLSADEVQFGFVSSTLLHSLEKGKRYCLIPHSCVALPTRPWLPHSMHSIRAPTHGRANYFK